MGHAKRKSNKRIIFDWLIPIVTAFIIALVIKEFFLYKVYIPSESMVPTISKGDQLFVSRVYDLQKIKRGDILVFKSEELDDILVKRVVGLPGDRILINKGVVSVNGNIIDEPYVQNNSSNYGSFEVPQGKYFFLGDNRADSYDSSKWGNPYIDGKDIQAKARVKVYPFSDIQFIK